MQNSIFLILITIFSAALSQSCNGLPAVCAANNCPAAPTVQVNSFTYSPEDFNLVSFGSLTINSGDVEGRVAVRNNLNAPSSGISIGYSLPNASSPSYSLVAGGNVNWVNGEIYPVGSNFFVGGTFTGAASLASKATGTCQSGTGCLNTQFNTLSQYYTAVSAALAGAVANVNATVVYQQLVLQCSGSASIYTVQVAASTFNGITSYETEGCDASSTFLFNIMGDGKVMFQGRAFSSHIAVFNIPMASTVEVDTFVYGDIIAPSSTLNQTAGTIAGVVVANDIPALVQVNTPLCPNQTATTGVMSTSAASSTSTSTGSVATTSTGSVSTTSGDASSGVSSTSTTGVPSASSTTTTGVPSATSTGSTTGNGGNPICTFLDNQAACPNVVNSLLGNYTFVFGNYDVLVFGDLTANSGDIEGRTFVSGNVNLPNGQFSFGLRASSANNDYTLVAGGLNFPSGSIRGRAFIAGTVTAADYINARVDGPCTNGSCLDAIRSAGQSCYQSVSDSFAAQSNAALTLTGNQVSVTCNSNTDSVYYINTDSAAATSAGWGDASNCNSGAIFVFNIGGSDDFTFSGASFPNNNAVFNVRGSRTVTIGASVHGNILAPSSNVVMSSGLITGKLVAASATVVQVNIPAECVNVDGNTGANSGVVSGNTDNASAGINVTPSILVMIVALFFSRLF